MRKGRRSAALALTGIVVIACLPAVRSGTGREGRGEGADRERLRYDKPREAQQFHALKRAPVGETAVPVERYLVAKQQMRAMSVFSTRSNRFLSFGARRTPGIQSDETAAGAAESNIAEAGFGGAWTSLGPGNVGGRTRGLVIHPTTPNTMYAAGVAGGVWKTTNGGNSWTPLDDMMANLAVASLALDPGDPDTLYAGTGEGYFNIDAVRGAGIFKTTDAGATWTQLSSTSTSNFHFVNDIVVSPNNSQRVYAATRTGVWRSTDGGASFPSQVIGASSVNGCTDLAIRTDQGTDFMFAACGTFVQATVFRKTDAENAGAWTAVLTETNMGRTSLAIAPSNQDTVYALSASIAPGNYEDGLHAVFRSTTGGGSGSWTAQVRNTNPTLINTLLLTNPPFASGCPGFGGTVFLNQGWYDNVIAVDPADANRVWVGGIDIFRSDNGGTSWGLASHWWASSSNARYSHADKHAIVFDPDYNGSTNQTMFVGTDGGVYRTDNARAAVTTNACNTSNGNVTWTALNNGYGVTQFYYGVPYPDGNTYFGGTQDNGTVRGTDAGGADNWTEVLGGDGGAVAVDPGNTNILYAENTGLSIQKSTNGGSSFADAVSGIGDGGFLFIAPFVMDPSNSQRLWTGGSLLWRTANGASSWSRASAALGTSGSVSALAVAPTNANFVLAGKANGAIHRTSVGLTAGSGTSWPSATPRAGYVSSLAFNPVDESVAYATYSTFGGIHVWKSENAGGGWSPLDGAGVVGDPGHLPDIPVHSIVVDAADTQRLYVGTDLGVFVSTDGGANWAVENTGFANVVTEALVVSGDELFGFTHGRGAWRVALLPASPPDIFISDVTVTEGNTGTVNASFIVSLSNATNQTVSVQYATADGTATAPADYATSSGTLTFTPGQTNRTIAVPVAGDLLAETNETFLVNLSNPTNSNLADSQGTGTIFDDDTPGTLQLGSAAYTVGEAAGSVTVDVLRPDGTSGGVSVDYATANGSATAASDYTAKSGTLSFGVGVTSLTFTVPITGDTLDEADEDFTVSISNPTGGAVLGSPTTATVTVTDDDTAGTLAFSLAAYKVSEAGAKATITVSRTGGAASGVTVGYEASDGSAVTGSDYTAVAGTLSFGANAKSASFTVPVTNDGLIEGDEAVVLRIFSPGGGATLGTPSTALLTLTDNDLGGAIRFSAASYSVSESLASATITATRTGGTGGPVTVDYQTSGGTATPGSDYTTTSGTLTFAAGQTSRTFTVPLTPDTDDEDNESVGLQLSNAAGGATLGSPASATLTLVDNDSAGSVQFSLTGYTVDESSASALITATRSGGSAGPVTVDYQTANGSATAGSDYSSASGTLTFGSGVLGQSFAVPITDDGSVEGPETVDLTLSNATGRLTLGARKTAVLTITDDEPGVTLHFSAPGYTVTEGSLATLTVKRSGPTTSALTVNYQTNDGSALAGSDYTAASGTLSFKPGISTLTFKLTTTGDSQDESDEDLTLTLGNPTGGASLGTQATATLKILDNDAGGALKFSAAAYSRSEGLPTATITVSRTGGLAGGVTVNYASSDGTAQAGLDYTTTSGTLSFASGQASRTFTVPILPDALDEANETLSLTLSNPTGGASLGSPIATTLTILDNDVAGTVQFNAGSYSVGESGSTATITVTRSGGAASGVTVDYATSDGTAQAGSDYTAASGTLTFNAGILTQTLAVTIADDGTVEGSETVNLALSNPSGVATLGVRSSALLTIADNDGVTLHFSAPTYSVTEGGSGVVTVKRSGSTASAVSVQYATSDGTATIADGDYTAKSGTLSFKAGQTSLIFSVATKTDTRDESNETVNLALSNPTGGAILGTQSTATLTIADNDAGGVLKFGSATYSRGENLPTATITVTRTGGVASGVSVNYASTNGTAQAGLDYTTAAGTLSFAAGQASRTFTVTLANDTLDEASETLTLDLSGATGGASIGSSATTTLTILDNDVAGTLQFSAGSYSVGESDGTLTVTVTRSGGAASGVTLNYATSNGTATAGSDYTSTSGPLMFAASETTRTFAVTITPDGSAEANETVALTLSAPGGGATLGSPSTATLYIVDDE